MNITIYFGKCQWVSAVRVLGTGDIGILGSNFQDDFLGSLLGAFMASITNIAAGVMLVSWFRTPRKWVSWLALLGAGAAIYWAQEILLHHHFEPAASVCWTVGFLLMALGYEMKRRSG